MFDIGAHRLSWEWRGVIVDGEGSENLEQALGLDKKKQGSRKWNGSADWPASDDRIAHLPCRSLPESIGRQKLLLYIKAPPSPRLLELGCASVLTA